jgi:nucleoside-diphosphate-sugar epimerase
MPILVITGQGGEVGTGLCQSYALSGQPVLRLDDLTESRPLSHEKVRLLHSAGRADEGDPAGLLAANLDYLRQVLHAAREHKVDEIIFISSVSVYGKQDCEQIAESAPLQGPGLYGLTKLIGEKLCETTGIPTLVVRLPAVLELGKMSNFMSRTFEKLRHGEDIEIFNAEREYNNFVDIPTLAGFLRHVRIHPGYDVINLACRAELSLASIVMLLKACLQSNSQVHCADARRHFFNLSIDKAVRDYDYQPGDVREILRTWCRQRLSREENPNG